MPEGDTIFRAARTLRHWLVGRTILAARGRGLPGPALERVVGRTVEAVEPRGKHLLVRLDDGLTIHTHLRMTGAWHVYPAGAPWRRPERQATLVLETGDRVAVCFNAPVVELLTARDELLHPSLQGLGPDVLAPDFDLAEVRRRARTRPLDTPVGDLLLDQRVVSGIGNIYRCEALFVRRLHPETAVGELGDDELDALVTVAADLLRAAAGSAAAGAGGAARSRFVYGRTKRPCLRCRTPIVARRMGRDARTAYWCPACQVLKPAPNGH